MKNEIMWKAIKGFNGIYEISEYGAIRSLTRTEKSKNAFGEINRKRVGKILKTAINPNGYVSVELNNDGKAKRCLVHRLVYESFVDELKEKYIIHHKDENKTNNHYSNLIQIDSYEHNRIHAHTPWNKGISNPAEMTERARISREKTFLAKCKTIYDLYQSGSSIKEISELSSVSRNTVYHRINTYKSKTNRG